MPVEATWLLDKRVTYFRAYGVITGADLVDVVKLQLQHHEEGIAPVHTIVDVQGPSIKVPSLAQMRQFSSISLHANTGWMVMLGSERSIITFWTSAIIQMIGSKHFKVARSIAEVVEFLNHNDPTLNLTVETVRAYIESHTAPEA